MLVQIYYWRAHVPWASIPHKRCPDCGHRLWQTSRRCPLLNIKSCPMRYSGVPWLSPKCPTSYSNVPCLKSHMSQTALRAVPCEVNVHGKQSHVHVLQEESHISQEHSDLGVPRGPTCPTWSHRSHMVPFVPQSPMSKTSTVRELRWWWEIGDLSASAQMCRS